MPTLDETHRAPAEVTQTGYVFALNRVLSRLADVFLPCRHRNITLPFNDRQTCLDCGAKRLYIFNTDFEHAAAGIIIGKWRKGLSGDTASLAIVRKLLDKAQQPNLAFVPEVHQFGAMCDELGVGCVTPPATQKAGR